MKRLFASVGFTGLFSIICAYILSPYISPVIVLISAAVISFALLLLFILSKRGFLKRADTFGALLICAVAATVFIGLFSVQIRKASLTDEKYSGTLNKMTVTVVSSPLQTSSGTSLTVKGNGLSVQAYSPTPLEVSVGDVFTAWFYLESLSGDEYETYLRGNGVDLRGEIKGEISLAESKNGFFSFIGDFLDRAGASLERFVGGHESDIAKALVYGDKSGLDSRDVRSLKGSGLYHAVVVSGQQVSLLAAILVFVFEALGYKSFSASLFRFIASVLFAFLAAAVAEFAFPVLRAMLMLILASTATLLLKSCDTLNGLGVALTVILLFDPWAALSASLLLSFGATLGMILFARPLSESIRNLIFKRLSVIPSRIFSYMTDLFTVGLAASVVTALVTFVFFGTVPIMSPVSSLLCIFAISVTFILGCAVILLSACPLFSPFSYLLGFATRIGVNYVMNVSDLLARIPLSNYSFSDTAFILAVIAALAVFILRFVFKPKKMKKRASKKYNSHTVTASVLAFVVILAVASAGGMVSETGLTAEGEYRLAFVDVGQGNGATLTKGTDAVIIDCGGNKNSGDAMCEYLRKNNISTVSYFFLTHLDSDHMNGVDEVLDEFDVEYLVLCEFGQNEATVSVLENLAAQSRTEIIYLTDDKTFEFYEADILALTAHIDPEGSDPNENGTVYLFDLYDVEALFPGDIGFKSEILVVNEYGALIDTEILAVGHHGSKNSSGASFVSAVSPDAAVISVGQNSYGHPTSDAIGRLDASGCDIYRTDILGDVIFSTDGQTFALITQ